MVYRARTIRDGQEDFDAVTYATLNEAIESVRAPWRKGLVDTAWVEDDQGDRTEWPTIKAHLEGSK